MNLEEFLNKQVEKYGSKIFLYGVDAHVSYEDFKNITSRMAYGFRRMGIRTGDRIAVLHPNHTETLLAYYAIIKAGGVVVPVNSLYTAPEIQFILNNSGARALIASEEFEEAISEIKSNLTTVEQIVLRKNGSTLEEAIEEIVDHPLKIAEPTKNIDLNSPAFIVYTSGTTGNPKGVILSHGNFCFVGPNMAQTYGLRDDDIGIAVLPLCHIFAIATPFLGSLSSGGSVVILDRFKPEKIFDAIDRYKVTWFPGVPTMFIYLLSSIHETDRNLSTLRMGVSGGASLPLDILEKWEGESNASILEVYGLTESTGLVTANPAYGIRKAGSIGINAAGITAKVINSDGTEAIVGDVGELIFKGPNAMKGYFGLPKETAEKIQNGWVYTGDHAYRDTDGYFYIAGRKNDLIISGGYNIYPREIEEVIQSHEAVQEVAVIGIKDAKKGEIPKAYISLKNNMIVTEEDIANFCRKKLARYKIPIIEFMADLPKNQVGKIIKKLLPKN